MKLSLCNEVVRDLPFEAQCELAASLGFSGLEIAPFTFGDEAYRMPASERAKIRNACAASGIAVSGLHWLLTAPTGLSITIADGAVREKTVEVMRRLVDLCAELGGSYLVHGSPAQRRLADNADRASASQLAQAAWEIAGAAAQSAKVTYCIEPLAPEQSDFVNTVAEAAAIVRAIANPALSTMVDTSAAAQGEAESVSETVARWLPTGLIAHIHLNDRNRRGPGQGDDRFTPVLAALLEDNYKGWIGIEPFIYLPDGPTCAARSIGYVAGILESLRRESLASMPRSAQ